MATPTRQSISALTLQLSGYIAGAVRKAPPREVIARAKIHLVDTFAAMISGSRLAPGQTALAYVRTLGLIELVFTLLISLYAFRERPGRAEVLGLALLIVSIALVLNSGK